MKDFGFYDDGVWYRDNTTVFILEGGINRYRISVDIENNKSGDVLTLAEFIRQVLNGFHERS